MALIFVRFLTQVALSGIAPDQLGHLPQGHSLPVVHCSLGGGAPTTEEGKKLKNRSFFGNFWKWAGAKSDFLVIFQVFSGLESRIFEWREGEHEDIERVIANDPQSLMDLRNCGLLKYFEVPGMRAQPRLLEYVIGVWDAEERFFRVGTHILTL